MTYSNTTDSTPMSTKGTKSVRWWIKQIESAETEARRFREQAREAYNEYTYSSAYQKTHRFNIASNQHLSIFYSSKRTLIPAIYSQLPTPVIKRRFDDSDDVSRVGSEILERLSRYLMEEGELHHCLRRSTQDYAITCFGQGRAYVENTKPRMIRQYLKDDEPLPQTTKFETDEQGRRYVEQPDPLDPAQKIIPKWQPWDTCIHTPGARDWCDVWWKGFVSYWDKQKFLERFDPDGSKKLRIKGVFRYNQRRDEKYDQAYEYQRKDDEMTEGEFAKVTEVWDYRNKKVYWICEEVSEMYLDEQEDLYKLRKFYPSPRPMQEMSGDQSLYPTPEYIQTRCVLENIDFLMNRMWQLTKALRTHGVYDKNEKALQRLINETDEADLVPVDNIADMLGKSGGFNIPIVYADKTHLAQALLQTYDAIDRQKEFYYEVTGQSDLMRGVVAASESATATATKDKFIGIRLSEHTQNVENFARDMLEIMLDLALEVFDDETILLVTSADQFTEEDQEHIPAALELIRNDKLRTFKINIETDSTIAVNSENEKQTRIELLSSVSEYMDRLIQVMQVMPDFAPMMMDLILHTIRGMNQSTDIESSIETAFNTLRESMKAEAEAPPEEEEPDPAAVIEQLKAQVEMEKLNVAREEIGLKGQEIALEQQKLVVQSQGGQQGNDFDQLKEQLEVRKRELEVEKKELEVSTTAIKSRAESTKAEGELMAADFQAQIQSLEQQVLVMSKQLETAQEFLAQAKEPQLQPKRKRSVGSWIETSEGRKMVVETEEV